VAENALLGHLQGLSRNFRSEFLDDPKYLRRKIGFGNRSADGGLAVARLFNVSRAFQLHQINALVYLSAAVCCWPPSRRCFITAETANALLRLQSAWGLIAVVC